MCGCGIERENIFGSEEVFEKGGSDEASGGSEVFGGGKVSALARGNEVVSIGLLFLDNVSRTGDEMNCRFRLRGTNDRVLKDATVDSV